MRLRLRLMALAVLCCSVVSGCSQQDGFSAALVAAADKGAGTVVAFRDLTRFEWDAVYIYGPYQPLAPIDARHGLDLRRGEVGAHVPEGQCLYIFRQANRVAASIYGPRYCSGILNPGKYTRASAAFLVQGQAPNWQLAPLADNPCEP